MTSLKQVHDEYYIATVFSFYRVQALTKDSYYTEAIYCARTIEARQAMGTENQMEKSVKRKQLFNISLYG